MSKRLRGPYPSTLFGWDFNSLKVFQSHNPHKFAQKIQDIFSTIHPYFLQNDSKFLGEELCKIFPLKWSLAITKYNTKHRKQGKKKNSRKGWKRSKVKVDDAVSLLTPKDVSKIFLPSVHAPTSEAPNRNKKGSVVPKLETLFFAVLVLFDQNDNNHRMAWIALKVKIKIKISRWGVNGLIDWLKVFHCSNFVGP